MKTSDESPIVYMFTYRQEDYIGPPVWFVVVILFFPSPCKIQSSVQTYLSLTRRCDAVRALLREQCRAAFLTSLSNRSNRHTMTALITSLYSHHLGFPQWCPFRTAVSP